MAIGGLRSAAAQNAENNLEQLNHRVFTANDGAPVDINAIAQTADGILWIGSRNGLSRFDGVRFISYPQPGEAPLQQNNVYSLFVTREGAVWIGFRPVGVALLKDGKVTSYSEADGLPNGSVAQFAEDREGVVWAATRTGLARLVGKRWERVEQDGMINSPYGVLVDRAGTLWAAATDGLFARFLGQHHFERIDHRVYDSPWTVLAEGPNGDVWAASGQVVTRLDRRMNPADRKDLVVEGISGGPLLVDRTGGLWGAELNPNSLLRVPSTILAKLDERQLAVEPERFTREDGLGSSRVFALFEDRESNVWVGTNEGLHRFSRSNVVRDAAPLCTQGKFLAAAVAAGESGSLWMACTDGSESHVNQIRDGQVVSRQNTPDFTAAYRDHQGIVWFAGSTHLAHVEANQVVIDDAIPPSVRGRPVQALMREQGTTWISFSRKGTYRIVAGQWLEYGGLASLPRGSAYAALEDSKKRVWLGYTNNRVAQVNGGEVRIYEARDGLQVGNVMAMVEISGQIWIGGELGLARFGGARFDSIQSVSGAPFRGISGIVHARNGDLWLNGTNGIVHIAAAQIQQLEKDPHHRVDYELFNHLDGVPGTAVQGRPLPTAIEATDGRIWFSTSGGVISIDATRLTRNPLPPPVKIWSVTSNAMDQPNFGHEIIFPTHTTDLQIQYSAGSLAVPERVRFRYKLEGSDRNWRDVGTRREAVYTNLAPGHYTFRVTASNNDGVWNEIGAASEFYITPAFYQTSWFYVLCGVALVVALTGLYKLRVSQVAGQVRGRLEARLAERERIARDLHDTLLQGVQGLIWRFQAVSEEIPSDHGRQRMEEVLERADSLLAESRDKVKDLRPTPGSMSDLADALATQGEQLAELLRAAKFRVTVQGTHRDLHPIVREEGFLIAREALGNAFQHSGADNIEVEVIYETALLQVLVRDDGQGIDATVLSGGKPAHFGLLGMRERAKKLGAHLNVWSKPGAGTEVDLRVPAEVAYPLSTDSPRRLRSRLASRSEAERIEAARPWNS
jgi:signal transduction histidine kinase/ligand-binding sensor domain-containing protein